MTKWCSRPQPAIAGAEAAFRNLSGLHSIAAVCLQVSVTLHCEEFCCVEAAIEETFMTDVKLAAYYESYCRRSTPSRRDA